MVFKAELSVNLRAKDIEVGTSSDIISRQAQVTKGRVHNPGSTMGESLSFVRIQHLVPVIAPLLNPSQVHVNGLGTGSCPCYLRTTASSVESSA